MSLPDHGAFEFFKKEIGDTDIRVRAEAMGKLPLIATLMGPEKTRSDLLPFLRSISFSHNLSKIFIFYY
jgi:hypothetical protein